MKTVFQPYQYFALGQLVLALSLLISFIIIPDYFFSLDQGGISNYGTDDRTIVLFSLGFGAATVGSYIAAFKLFNKLGLKNVQYQLLTLSLFYGLVLLTTYPYKISTFYENSHILVSFGLSVLMTILVVHIRRTYRNDNFIKRLFILYCLGFSIALMTLFGLANLLFNAQIISGFSFSAIMTRYIYLKTVSVSQ